MHAQPRYPLAVVGLKCVPPLAGGVIPEHQPVPLENMVKTGVDAFHWKEPGIKVETVPAVPTGGNLPRSIIYRENGFVRPKCHRPHDRFAASRSAAPPRHLIPE